jgi:hypothetical protein
VVAAAFLTGAGAGSAPVAGATHAFARRVPLSPRGEQRTRSTRRETAVPLKWGRVGIVGCLV